MREEDALQIRCKRWLSTALPLEVVWTGIEHAAQLSLRQGAIRKAKGIKRGLPDFLFWHTGLSIAVELKTATGVQSDPQRDFMERFRAAGGIYAVCRSEQEMERVLRAAGVPVNFAAPAPWVSVPADGKKHRSSVGRPRAAKPKSSSVRRVEKIRSRVMF